MADMLELHNKWRGFTADRAVARREIDEKVDANNAEIERLRMENIDLNTGFQEKWSKAKKQLQEDRDRAVMEALAEGMSGQEVLRILGSRNTVWIYDLRKRLAAEGRLPEAVNENSPIERIKEANERKASKTSDSSDPFAHVKWLRIEEPEFAGWSISDDFTLVKRERRGGIWFICGPQNEYVDGDKHFYDSTDTDLIEKQADALMARLEDADAS